MRAGQRISSHLCCKLFLPLAETTCFGKTFFTLNNTPLQLLFQLSIFLCHQFPLSIPRTTFYQHPYLFLTSFHISHQTESTFVHHSLYSTLCSYHNTYLNLSLALPPFSLILHTQSCNFDPIISHVISSIIHTLTTYSIISSCSLPPQQIWQSIQLMQGTNRLLLNNDDKFMCGVGVTVW